MQAHAEAEAAKGSELSDEERWEAGVAAVAAAGDPEAAARCCDCFCHSDSRSWCKPQQQGRPTWTHFISFWREKTRWAAPPQALDDM